MDQSRAPVVDASKAFRESDHLTFLPPGHKQGRGVDKRVLDALAPTYRRVAAQITVADDEDTTDRLLHALRDLAQHADDLPAPRPIALPAPGELELEQVMLPRDAFFGPAEQIPAAEAVGRICAETISPYPPGVPALLPGEIITKPVVDYLRTGVAAGMLIPDSFDKQVGTIRVVAKS